MFSAQGLPLGSDTLEYAWLIDMQAGGLTGRVSVPQVRPKDDPDWLSGRFMIGLKAIEHCFHQNRPSKACFNGVCHLSDI